MLEVFAYVELFVFVCWVGCLCLVVGCLGVACSVGLFW